MTIQLPVALHNKHPATNGWNLKMKSGKGFHFTIAGSCQDVETAEGKFCFTWRTVQENKLPQTLEFEKTA